MFQLLCLLESSLKLEFGKLLHFIINCSYVKDFIIKLFVLERAKEISFSTRTIVATFSATTTARKAPRGRAKQEQRKQQSFTSLNISTEQYYYSIGSTLPRVA